MTSAITRRNGLTDLSNETIERSDFRLYTPEEAERLLTYLGTWLPTVTGDENVHATDAHTSTPTEDDEVQHVLVQNWGTKPAPEAFAQAGTTVEIAGPTFDNEGGSYFLAKYGAEPDLVSDVFFDQDDETYQPIDFAADAARLPLAPESVGTIFCRGLPGRGRELGPPTATLRDDALTEAASALKPGGYLVWESGTPEDYAKIVELGLSPRYLDTKARINENTASGDFYEASLSVNGVYQKPLVPAA